MYFKVEIVNYLMRPILLYYYVYFIILINFRQYSEKLSQSIHLLCSHLPNENDGSSDFLSINDHLPLLYQLVDCFGHFFRPFFSVS